MNRDSFMRQFKRFEKLFFKELTIEQLDAFWFELQAMSDDEFIKACHLIVKEERWFPSISCFLKDLPYQPIKTEREKCPECKTDKVRSGMHQGTTQHWTCERGHKWTTKVKAIRMF